MSDYVSGAEEQLLLSAPRPDLPETKNKTISRRGLMLPIYALGIAAAALWVSGAFDTGVAGPERANAAPVEAAAARAAATSSRGLVFGLCDQGGGTNCVVDGDSFHLGGTAIRVAGIDAPRTHSASCDAEALLGWAATERLHAALNSGTVTTIPVEPGQDANGRLLRQVKVDGRDVGDALTAAGLARASDGKNSAAWC